MKDSAIMDDIFINSIGPRRFHVQIREGDGAARHYHVTVPENLIAELQLPKKTSTKGTVELQGQELTSTALSQRALLRTHMDTNTPRTWTTS
jgi:hypothetical protein